MQKELWENAWASGEALASPYVTFVTPPNGELARRLTQTHTHITVTNKVLLLHTPNCGPIQCNTWFLHCVQIIKTITYYTFHVMWDELDDLEWSKSMDRTDWPKEDGFYKLINYYPNGLDHPTNWEDPDLDEGFTVSAMILGKKLYLNSRSKLVVRPSPQFFPLFYINLLILGFFLNKEVRLKKLKESR